MPGMAASDSPSAACGRAQRTLGIFAKTFERASVGEVFAAVAAHGLSTVQFNMACVGLPTLPGTVPEAVLDAIRAGAERNGVAIAALSGTYNMIHPDVTARRAAQQRLEALMRTARAIGAGIVTLCSGTRDSEDQWRGHPDNGSWAAWRDLTLALTELLPAAERHGVVLAVEPEPANVVGNAKRARALLDEMRSPALGIILDPANLLEECTPAGSRAKIDEALDLLGPEIVLGHAKDRDGSGAVCAPGQGVVDFAHYLAGLNEAGFAGAVVMHGFAERDAGVATAHLRRLIADGADRLP
jgi:sugar phosphate isomerase/epimerase